MKRSAVVGVALRAVAAVHTTAACTPGAGLHHDGEAGEPPPSSLGVATPRVSEYGWEAVRLNDFSADGMGDILWNDPEQNLIAIWLMEGDRLLAPGPFLPGPIGQGWAAVNAGDFNFDGMADVLWFDAEQNLVTIWLMEGTHLLAPGPVLPGPLGDGWLVKSVSDFNLDGMGDVLWNNPEQNLITVWLMEGTHLLAPGPFIPGPAGEGWVAPTAQDVNFDNMGDVFWNNPEQNLMAVWLMEGTELLAPGPVIPGPLGPGWRIITSTDFNFDSMGDVLWNSPEQNLMAVWLMEGTHLLAPGPAIPGPLGPGWEAQPGADVSFDGLGDVLWYAIGTNQAAVWLMEGTHLLAPGPVILGPYDGG
ncbi:FG-GAP repeat domain-containing protein [Sorangium sp. So ce1099]|uniref:FG-GAP repeat domain-containing protein n=1 Tax=Sorangium sp. So ce1099 TaxID=3133331 RepID=UPI003F61BD40